MGYILRPPNTFLRFCADFVRQKPKADPMGIQYPEYKFRPVHKNKNETKEKSTRDNGG